MLCFSPNALAGALAAGFILRRTFADCSGSLRHPDVIRAISGPDAAPYRFPLEAQPYRHQIAASEHLTAPEPRSVLVPN